MPSRRSSVEKVAAKASRSRARHHARVRVLPLLEHALGRGHRQGAQRGELLARFQRRVHQLFGSEDPVDQADAQRELGVDGLAAQDQLLGPGHAHPSRQPHRAAEAGQDAQLDLGLPEARLTGGVDPVAGQGQLAAAAQRRSR